MTVALKGQEDALLSTLPSTASSPTLRHAFSGLPMRELEIVQIGRGRSEHMGLLFFGRDVLLSRMSSVPKSSVHAVPDPEWVVLNIALRWQGDYIFNGQSVAPDEVFLSADHGGYFIVAQERDVIGVGLRRSRLIRTLQALSGRDDDDVALLDLRIALGKAQAGRLRRTLFGVIGAALHAPLGGGHFALFPTVENDLYSALALMLLDHLDGRAPRDPDRVDALRVVRAARRAVDLRGGPQPSLADLCAASGVGTTWLHKCFKEVCGTSPIDFLRARRLSIARDRLADPASPPLSVKDVALSLGFVASGRFAADYRARFGESPSETFAAHGSAALRAAAGDVPVHRL